MSGRIDRLLAAKAHIKEYFMLNLDDLMKIKNGSVIVQTACEELGIFDTPALIEMANTVWVEIANSEIARIRAKESLKQGAEKAPVKISEKDPDPPPDTSLEAAVGSRLAEVFAQQQRDHEEALAVFGDAIEYLTAKLNEPKPSLWTQIKDCLKAKLGVKSRS
jgi:hypothetical protein